MSTIRDIANKAGVSKSTASLALNGDERVLPKTRQRVLEAAEALDYHPLRAAKSLSSGRTWSLQLLNPVTAALSSGFFTRFTRGVHDVAQDNGYTVALSVLEDVSEAEKVLERLISERWADGVLLLNATQAGTLLQRMVTNRFPHVLIGRSDTVETLSVDNDNVRVGFDATRHLLENELAPVALINGPAHQTFTQDRAAGFKTALAEAGYDAQNWISFTDGSAEAARQVVAGWGTAEIPRSVIAVSDTLALGALKGLRERGLQVPQDVALVGMDNDDVAEYVLPQLSSVDLHAYDLGREAAALLVASLTTGVAPDTRRIVPHHLVIRDSSA